MGDGKSPRLVLKSSGKSDRNGRIRWARASHLFLGGWVMESPPFCVVLGGVGKSVGADCGGGLSRQVNKRRFRSGMSREVDLIRSEPHSPGLSNGDDIER